MRDENQLHAAIVEIIVHDRAEVKYSTVQNWYPGDAEGKGGVYNLSLIHISRKRIMPVIIASVTLCCWEISVVHIDVDKRQVKKEPEKREPEVKKEEVVTPPVSVVEPTPDVYKRQESMHSD